MSNGNLSVSHVSKRFRIGVMHDSLGELVSHGLARWFGRRAPSKPETTLWAVKDVSFAVGSGEALGIIGPNGAGKSTILKLLAGILTPDGGSIRITGRLAALIEVGAGFHGDLTGRENIYLNGSILGMKRAEIRRKLDDIVSFAGLARFLDTPVKRYSSGMYARLGFSIAAHVDPQVLLVDEVLSVGDAVFRLRCLDRMRELLRRGTTLVFVTHDLEQMQGVCDQALVLERGSVTYRGTAREAVGQYLSAMSRAYAQRPPDLMEGEDRSLGRIEIQSLRVLDQDGHDAVWVRPGKPLRVELCFELSRRIPRLIVELNLRAKLHENLLSVNSGRDDVTFNGTVGRHTVTLHLPSLPLTGGQYLWNVRMWNADNGQAELDTPFQYPMAIDDGGCKTGVVCLEHEWASIQESRCEVERMSPQPRSGISHQPPAIRHQPSAVSHPPVAPASVPERDP